jgi:SAM-dependent methyltransferase
VSDTWDEVAASYGDGGPVFAAFAERLVDRAAIAPGERVADLGCGNGLGTAAAVRAAGAGRAVGVDFSEAMVRACRRRAPGALLARADVTRLPFPPGAFDVVLASSVFQFVRYSVDVLTEWRRVLAPGGRLLLSIPTGVSGGDVNGVLMTEFFDRLPEATQARFLTGGPPPAPPDLADVCRHAGFSDAVVTDEEFPVTVESLDRWWEVQWTHGFRGFLREFDDGTLAEMRSRAFELLAPHLSPAGELAGTQTFSFCAAR